MNINDQFSQPIVLTESDWVALEAWDTECEDIMCHNESMQEAWAEKANEQILYGFDDRPSLPQYVDDPEPPSHLAYLFDFSAQKEASIDIQSFVAGDGIPF